MSRDERNLSWSDCEAGRQEQAILIKRLLLNRFEASKSDKAKAQRSRDGVTNTYALNISAPWGYGKTFFVERLAQDLRGDGYATFFYSAWKYDQSQDALASLLSSLYAQIESVLKRNNSGEMVAKRLKKVWRGASNVLKNSASTGVRLLATPVVGGELAKTLGDNVSPEAVKEIVGKLCEESVNEMLAGENSYESALDEFKGAIESLAENDCGQDGLKLPIFIFIDDLDRCRPLFALEILEAVKHILNANGVYFIFSSDAAHLQESLRAVYGSGFDSEFYLKRIFNRECSLVEPYHDKFALYLFEDVGEEFKSENLIFPEITGNVSKGLSRWFSLLAQAFDLDLRIQIEVKEQVLDLLRIRKEQKTLVVVLMHLIILWNKKKEQAVKQSKAFEIKNKEYVKNSNSVTNIDQVIQEVKVSNYGMNDLLHHYYECTGETKGQVHEKYESTKFGTRNREVYDSILRYMPDLANTDTNGYPLGLSFEHMFAQIRMIS